MSTTPLNILITGCSSGFGKLTAETLAKDGHHVFASMRDIDGKNADSKAELLDWAEKEGVKIEIVELDVVDEAGVEAAISKVVESAGYIDVLVNNAGVASMGVLEAYSIDEIHKLFDVLTFGPLRVNRAVLPHMRKRKSGLIIHISSTAGRINIPFMGPYCAAKFALESIGAAYSYELAPFNIDSVILEPGAYATKVMDKLKMPDDGGRLAEYGDVANAPQKLFENVGKRLHGPGAPDPQEVADAVKKLIETPAGERPLRTCVGEIATAGIEELNITTEESRKKFIDSLTQ